MHVHLPSGSAPQVGIWGVTATGLPCQRRGGLRAVPVRVAPDALVGLDGHRKANTCWRTRPAFHCIQYGNAVRVRPFASVCNPKATLA